MTRRIRAHGSNAGLDAKDGDKAGHSHGGSQVLVVSRKQNEKIHIGDDITVHVVRVAGNVVRIGISAPPGLQIRRDKVRV